MIKFDGSFRCMMHMMLNWPLDTIHVQEASCVCASISVCMAVPEHSTECWEAWARWAAPLSSRRNQSSDQSQSSEPDWSAREKKGVTSEKIIFFPPCFSFFVPFLLKFCNKRSRFLSICGEKKRCVPTRKKKWEDRRQRWEERVYFLFQGHFATFILCLGINPIQRWHACPRRRRESLGEG